MRRFVFFLLSLAMPCYAQRVVDVRLNPGQDKPVTVSHVGATPLTIRAAVPGIATNAASLVVRNGAGAVKVTVTNAAAISGSTYTFETGAGNWAPTLFTTATRPGQSETFWADVRLAGYGVPLPLIQIELRYPVNQGTEAYVEPTLGTWVASGSTSSTIRTVIVPGSISGDTLTLSPSSYDDAWTNGLRGMAFVDDAPSNTNTYGRRSNEWVVITSGGGTASDATLWTWGGTNQTTLVINSNFTGAGGIFDLSGTNLSKLANGQSAYAALMAGTYATAASVTSATGSLWNAIAGKLGITDWQDWTNSLRALAFKATITSNDVAAGTDAAYRNAAETDPVWGAASSAVTAGAANGTTALSLLTGVNDDESVYLGNGATNNGYQNGVALGISAQTVDHEGVAVGWYSSAGYGCAAVGAGATANGTNNISIGSGALISSGTNTAAIGIDSAAGAGVFRVFGRNVYSNGYLLGNGSLLTGITAGGGSGTATNYFSSSALTSASTVTVTTASGPYVHLLATNALTLVFDTSSFSTNGYGSVYLSINPNGNTLTRGAGINSNAWAALSLTTNAYNALWFFKGYQGTEFDVRQ